MSEHHDYQGNPIEDKYQPDADSNVTVWELDNGSEILLIRDWNVMWDHVTSMMDDQLADMTTDPSDKVTLTWKLVSVTPARWKTFAESWADGREEGIQIYDIDNEGKVL